VVVWRGGAHWPPLGAFTGAHRVGLCSVTPGVRATRRATPAQGVCNRSTGTWPLRTQVPDSLPLPARGAGCDWCNTKSMQHGRRRKPLHRPEGSH
jgi:hypothetical protein